MAIRDKLRTNIQPYLDPGETVQAVFPATGGLSPYFLMLTYLLFFWVKYVIVAVTDKRILLFKASPLATTKPKELLGEFPRSTRLGPASGLYAKIDLGGTRYYVHKRFHADLKAADEAAPAAT